MAFNQSRINAFIFKNPHINTNTAFATLIKFHQKNSYHPGQARKMRLILRSTHPSTQSRGTLTLTRRHTTVQAFSASVFHGAELDDTFSDIICSENLMTIAGFGSLLSETSARSTFPHLQNFRTARVRGFRRVFAHSCDIFFDRGIARPETREVSSLSVEEHLDSAIVVTLFEIEAGPDAIAAFIQREHEFRFLAVLPEALHLHHPPETRPAVICGYWNDADYRERRCPPEEWERRYGRHGLTSIWNDDVLPCRTYLRHCVLAARKLGPEAERCFLETGTVLADRKTTIGEWLEANPDIMEELPPPSLIGRYSG